MAFYTSPFVPNQAFEFSDEILRFNYPCTGVSDPQYPTEDCNYGPYPKCLTASIGTIKEKDGKARCVFDLRKFDNETQLEEYHDIFGSTDVSFDLVAEKLCGLTTDKNCPVNPKTRKPHAKCMVARTDGRVGKICRDWGEKNSRKLDDMKEEWCRKNSDHEDCACILKAQNPDYTNIKQYFPYHDSCWYVPCVVHNGYMRFSDEPSCDNVNVCSIVYDLTKNKNVTLKNIVSTLNCGEGGKKVSSIPDSPVGRPSSPIFQTPERPSDPNPRPAFRWEIVMAAVAAVLLLILIIGKI